MYIKLRVALGNTQKPQVLETMEAEIWRGVIRIAIGRTPEDVFRDLDQAWQDLAFDLTADDKDWYTKLRGAPGSLFPSSNLSAISYQP